MNLRRPDSGAPRGGAQPGGRPRADMAPKEERGAMQPAGPGGEKEKKKKKAKGKLKPGTIILHMLLNGIKALFVVLCIGAIIGSVAVVQVAQYVVDATQNDEELLDLENFSMAQTSYFMAPNPNNPNAQEENDYVQYQALVGEENRIWIAYDQIPQDLINAVMATEDREFETHHGVNFRRTAAALINEIIPIEGMKGGASTITQQLIKNLTGDDTVGGEDGDDRTEGYKRKLREIFRAWGLENSYSKDMIMESYLNTISLSERIAGVEAGAQSYFGKTVSELTLAECAVIAGITQAPTYYSPFQNPDNALKRRNDVIQFMLDAEFITEAQAEEVWAMKTLGLKDRSSSSNTGSTSQSSGVFSYFTDKAYEDVIQDLMKQKGYTRERARWLLYNGGYRVYLTIDLNVQNALDKITVHGYDKVENGAAEDGYFMNEEKFAGYERQMTIVEDVLNSSNQKIGTQNVMPQLAAVVIDYDGQLKATSGGIGEKTSSLSLNRSIGTVTYTEDGTPVVQGTVRQVGSTMKMTAAYALGIDYGIITYSKMVMDAPIQARDPYNPRRDPETGSVIKDWPSNYGNKVRNYKIPVVSAIAESVNTVAAQVGMWVGREYMFEFLRDTLQVSSLVEPNDVDLGPLVLGSMTYGMSAYELAGCYMMYGGNETYGVFNSLHCYTRVEDAKGNIVLEPELTTVQAISAESGYILNRALSTVVNTAVQPGGANPTATGMKVEGEMDSVGKTGTTTEDNDRWFVGLTPYYVTAVWWGYDRDHTLLYTGGKGWQAGARRNIPINVWKDLMEEVQAELEYKEFPEQPEGIEEIYYCTISGERALAGCPGQLGYYSTSNLPENCPGHGTPEEGEEGAT